MNRSLLIPGACCLVAFAALLAILHGAAGWERPQSASAARRENPQPINSTLAYSAAARADHRLLSTEQAEQVLTALSGEFVRPWRQWESSPTRLYSRAAPRPLPSLSTEIQWAHDATSPSDSFFLATVTVSKGPQTQAVPCVVNRVTSEVRLFSDGQWVTAADWLKQAPNPGDARMPGRRG